MQEKGMLNHMADTEHRGYVLELDFIAHLVCAQAICAASMEVDPGSSNEQDANKHAEVTAQLNEKIGQWFFDKAPLIWDGCTSLEGAWDALITQISGLCGSSVDGLEANFTTHFERFARHVKYLGVGKANIDDPDGTLQRVLSPLLTYAVEKSLRLWKKATGSRRFPKVLIEGVDAVDPKQSADFCATAFPQRNEIVIKWLSYRFRTQRKDLVQWLCHLSAILGHEVGHCVCPRKYRPFLDNGRWIHGWLFFLTIADAHEKALRRSNLCLIEKLKSESLDRVLDEKDLTRIFGTEDELSSRGYDDARTAFKAIGSILKRRHVCVHYPCPHGLSTLATFLVFTRLNLGLPERYPICPVDDALRSSFLGNRVRLCSSIELCLSRLDEELKDKKYTPGFLDGVCTGFRTAWAS